MMSKTSSKSNTTTTNKTTTNNKTTTSNNNNNTAVGRGGIILRVRTQIGTWRVNDLLSSDTFKHIRSKLEDEHKVKLTNIPFTIDPSGKQVYDDDMTIQQAKLINGTMIYMQLDESNGSLIVHKSSTGLKRIEKDGSIVRQDTSSIFQSNGFRPGMLPLRSMKMQWTLNEFVSLDEQFQYKIKAPEKGICKLASIDSTAIEEFQNYMRNFDFRIMRIGYLYGRVQSDASVKVEFIYEPPQETTDVSFIVLDDPKEDAVNAITGMLNLQKVGWIFAHPAREKGFHFSGPEVLFTAEQQLEAANGVADTSFVTIKLSIDEKSQIIVEAYQVSKQCMEMVAEGVIEPSKNLGCVTVNPTFTAIVEGKNTKEIDNSFFLSTTPIEKFESQLLVNTFPKVNRIDVLQTRDDLKTQLSKVGKKGWTFSDLLADFQLLLYLCQFLDLHHDIPYLCKAVTEREIPLDDGYQLLIRSIAGFD